MGKEERTLSIFTDDMILHIENLKKKTTNKLFEVKMVWGRVWWLTPTIPALWESKMGEWIA